MSEELIARILAKDTRTEEQIIEDATDFIMGPGGDEGTIQGESTWEAVDSGQIKPE